MRQGDGARTISGGDINACILIFRQSAVKEIRNIGKLQLLTGFLTLIGLGQTNWMGLKRNRNKINQLKWDVRLLLWSPE